MAQLFARQGSGRCAVRTVTRAVEETRRSNENSAADEAAVPKARFIVSDVESCLTKEDLLRVKSLMMTEISDEVHQQVCHLTPQRLRSVQNRRRDEQHTKELGLQKQEIMSKLQCIQ